jgi:hypothetical protein
MAPTPAEVTIVPANEATWEDLRAVFGARGDPARCWCQRYKTQPRESWRSVGAEELTFRLREQTDCDQPRSRSTSGLVAYHEDQAVTCVLTRTGFRRRRITYALVRAAVDVARRRGARALEGYPITRTDVLLSELHVGSRGAFSAAGFIEVSHPTLRRIVMRIDL